MSTVFQKKRKEKSIENPFCSQRMNMWSSPHSLDLTNKQMSENLFFSLLLTVLPPKNNHFQCLYATLVPSTVREDCLRTANQRRIFFYFENQSWEQNEYEDREVLDYLILLLLLLMMTMVTVLGWIHWIFFYFEWHFIRFRCFFLFFVLVFHFSYNDWPWCFNGWLVCLHKSYLNADYRWYFV